jgi:hypothetical protein
LRVRFKTVNETEITKYIDTLRKYGEVETTLKRGYADPLVVVELENTITDLFNIMRDIRRELVVCENTEFDAEEVPLLVEISDKPPV